MDGRSSPKVTAPDFFRKIGKMETKECWVIVSLDGTLADSDWRKNLLPDWESFHAASVDDKPRQHVVDFVNALAQVSNIAVVTGRNEKHRGMTMQWLVHHGVIFHGLYMRPDDDFSKAGEFKVGVYENHLKNAGGVWLCLEDDPKCVDAYGAVGLACHQVGDGEL